MRAHVGQGAHGLTIVRLRCEGGELSVEPVGSSRVGFNKDYKFIVEGANEWQDVWVPGRAGVREDQPGRRGLGWYM